MKRLPSVTVVVCVYNGAASLADCLKALKAQKYRGKLQILVVDDGSKDDSYKIAQSFRGVTVIQHEQNSGLAAARNTGIKHAEGDIIAFTDDDCRPQPSWLRELMTAYDNPTVWGVGGDVVSTDKKTVVLRYLNESKPLKPLENTLAVSNTLSYRLKLYLKGLLGLTPKPRNRKRNVYSLVGANMSFRKVALESIGMFDEHFRFGGEEEDVCRRIITMHPEGLIYAPKAKIIHHFEPDLHDTLRRSRAYGRGSARMFHKYKDVRPVIFPFPIVVPMLVLLGFIWPGLIVAPFLVIPLIYARWLMLAWKKRRPEAIVYGYIQWLQEWYGNIGFIEGAWKYRHLFPRDGATEATKTTRHSWLPTIVLGALLLVVGHSPHFAWLHLPLAISLLLVPGYLLTRLIGFMGYDKPSLRLSLSGILGIVWAFVVSLVAIVVLPLFGMKHILSAGTLTSTYIVSLIVLTQIAPGRRRGARKEWHVNRSSFFLYAVSILLPLASFIGASLLNNGYGNGVIIAMFLLALVGVVIALFQNKELEESALPALLFSISLSALWTYSLRSATVFGWDIQQEYAVFQHTLAANTWQIGALHGQYDAMFSLTTFPVLLANLAHIAGTTIFKVLFPVMFSMLPVLLYNAYRQFNPQRWVAFTAATVTISQFYYMQQFSALARQQIGFLFFATLIFALVDRDLTRRTRHWLSGLAVIGLVLAHYSTVYITLSLLTGVYVVTKLALAVWPSELPLRVRIRQKVAITWPLLLGLALGALVWYGPATKSSAVAVAFFRPQTYVHDIRSVRPFVRIQTTHQATSSAVTATSYLATIGEQYHTNKLFLQYYSGATNSSLTGVSVPAITHRPVLYELGQVSNTVLRYSWWLLAMVAVGALFWRLRRIFEVRQLELGVLVAVATALFIATHLIPSIGNLYNVSRVTEQMLLLVALPAVLTLKWLIQRYIRRWQEAFVVILLCGSLILASGLINQFTGGVAPANLNNFGNDYEAYYTTTTDTAAAKWLGKQYRQGDTVFADRYAQLRLTTTTPITHGLFTDVTPSTIAKGAYVFADETNIAKGTASALDKGTVLEYQFPSSFLGQHKAILYTNGQAEIYR